MFTVLAVVTNITLDEIVVDLQVVVVDGVVLLRV
jgi:hypothetical protein